MFLLRLRLLFFRPHWRQESARVQTAQHGALLALVVRLSTGYYGWSIYHGLHEVARGELVYSDPDDAKYVARAGLLAGGK